MAMTATAAPMQVTPPAAFLWGDNGAQLTPEQAAAQQQVANAMIMNAPAPRSVGEGLSAIGRALVARSMLDQSSAAIQQGRQQAATDLQSVLADPSKAMQFISNDPFASDGQKAVAQAIMQQQMMLTNPDMIAQRANLAADTSLKQAQAAQMTTGGTAVGTPFQANDGSWWISTQYGGARKIAGPDTPSGGVPSAAPLSLPGGASPSSAPATVQNPLPAPAPLAPQVANPAPSPAPAQPSASSAPVFLTQAQQKEQDAEAAASGTAKGNAPSDVLTALSSSRSVNPLYQAGINNINRALNILTNDKGGIATTTGAAGLLQNYAPGTPGYELGVQLKSLNGLSALATMGNERGGSGGGSPIQIRNQQEFNAVAAAAGSLAQGQKKEDLITSLQNLKAQLQSGMANRAKDIGDMRAQFKLDGGLPISSKDDPYAGPGVYGAISAAPNGQPVVTTPQEAAQFPVGTTVITPNGPMMVTPQAKAQFGAQ